MLDLLLSGFKLFGVFVLLLLTRKICAQYRTWLLTLSYLIYLALDNRWFPTTTYHGSYIVWTGCALLLSFSAPFYFYFKRLVKSNLDCYQIFKFAIGFAILEHLRLYFFSGFPFSAFGVAFSSVPFFWSLLSFIGIYGCSFFIILGNLFIYKFFLSRKKSDLIAIILSIVAISIPCCFYFLQEEEIKPDLKVGIIQPRFNIEEKTWHPQFFNTFVSVENQIEAIIKQIYLFDTDLDLILLPEGVLPGFVDDDIIESCQFEKIYSRYFNSESDLTISKEYLNQLDIFLILAQKKRSTVVFGANRIDEKGRCYNGLFAISKDKKVSMYDKRVLVPLGESLPFEGLKQVAARYGLTGFFYSGDCHFIKIGCYDVFPSICYEDCFPLFKWDSIRLVPDFMINITNDGWFLPSTLPQSHAKLSKIRAIELGIPLIRSCENYMSGYVLKNGFSHFSEDHDNNKLEYAIPMTKINTLYPKLRESWLYFSLVFIIFYELVRSLKRTRFHLAQKQNLG